MVKQQSKNVEVVQCNSCPSVRDKTDVKKIEIFFKSSDGLCFWSKGEASNNYQSSAEST